jgi:hypothetical protein
LADQVSIRRQGGRRVHDVGRRPYDVRDGHPAVTRGGRARLAVDDFGAGSHALSRLRHLPLDALKLDRGFVAALDDERTAAIVAAAIKLDHELRVDVVADRRRDRRPGAGPAPVRLRPGAGPSLRAGARRR